MEPQYGPATNSEQPQSGNRFLIIALLVVVCILCVAMQQLLKRDREESRTNRAMAQLTSDSLKCRLALSRYLLSGDTRELSNLNELNQSVIEQLNYLKETGDHASEVKLDVDHVIAFQQDWNTGFAHHLINKRKEVDEGHASVADLQIRYLQEDPQGWDQRLDYQFDKLQKALKER